MFFFVSRLFVREKISSPRCPACHWCRSIFFVSWKTLVFHLCGCKFVKFAFSKKVTSLSLRSRMLEVEFVVKFWNQSWWIPRLIVNPPIVRVSCDMVARNAPTPYKVPELASISSVPHPSANPLNWHKIRLRSPKTLICMPATSQQFEATAEVHVGIYPICDVALLHMVLAKYNSF